MLARIRELQKQHLPLAEIRKHLGVRAESDPPSGSLSAAEYVANVLRGNGAPAASLAASPAVAIEGPIVAVGVAVAVAPRAASSDRAERSTWERITLTDGLAAPPGASRITFQRRLPRGNVYHALAVHFDSIADMRPQ